MALTLILILAAVTLLSAALTRLFYRYALARSLLDVPGERSSHQQATPRGGGAAIAVVYLGAILVFAFAGSIDGTLAWALVGGGSLVALIGWIDDHSHVSPLVRVLVHAVAGIWALAWLGGVPALTIGTGQLELGWGGFVLALVGIVWLTNLYNFMDGIDGIAGGQAVVAGLAGGFLLLRHGSPDLALPAFIVAAASLGFLVWNWPPARIFMGDVGSGLLGFNFAVLAVATENTGALPALVWVILLAIFIVDATLTLLRRILTGEKWYTAHKMHAYQQLVARGWGHRRVTVWVLVVNVAVLWPLAWFSGVYPDSLAWNLIAIGMLGCLVWGVIRRRVAA